MDEDMNDDAYDDDGHWVQPDYETPVDPDLSGQLMMGVHTVEAMWDMVDNATDEHNAMPVMICTFTTSVGEQTIVLNLGGMAILIEAIGSAMRHIYGIPDAANSNTLDLDLQRMLDRAYNDPTNEEGTDR